MGHIIVNHHIKHVTKIKNCSGFMKVDQIHKVWSLEYKNNNFIKIGGTKKIHDPNVNVKFKHKIDLENE